MRVFGLHNPMQISLSVFNEVCQVRLHQNIDRYITSRPYLQREIQLLDYPAPGAIGSKEISGVYRVLGRGNIVAQSSEHSILSFVFKYYE
jgi:hypothetical protein